MGKTVSKGVLEVGFEVGSPDYISLELAELPRLKRQREIGVPWLVGECVARAFYIALVMDRFPEEGVWWLFFFCSWDWFRKWDEVEGIIEVCWLEVFVWGYMCGERWEIGVVDFLGEFKLIRIFCVWFICGIDARSLMPRKLLLRRLLSSLRESLILSYPSQWTPSVCTFHPYSMQWTVLCIQDAALGANFFQDAKYSDVGKVLMFTRESWGR